MIEACKNNSDTLCNPIYKFTDKEIWEYAKKYNVDMNPLYEKGYKRVGCIGCPLGGRKQMLKEFQDYPKYKASYIRAFDRMLKRRREENKPLMKYDLETGEEVFRWWIGDDPNQMRMEDFIGGKQ